MLFLWARRAVQALLLVTGNGFDVISSFNYILTMISMIYKLCDKGMDNLFFSLLQTDRIFSEGFIQIEEDALGAIGSETQIDTEVGKCLPAEHDP